MRSPENVLAHLQKRAGDDWLIGYDSQELADLAEKLYLELIEQRSRQKTQLNIILSERNPIKFLASFIAAIAAECAIFLCNPDWVKAEWEQVFNLVQPDIIWADINQKLEFPNQKDINSSYPSGDFKSLIMIPTGGSSGKIRFAMHTWATLSASVQGFQQYFELDKINSFCVLPLYHVSGLMQFLRSFISGGKLVIFPFKVLEAGEKPQVDPKEFFISLVPTQLQRLLVNSTDWLSCFQTVLLGGAPAWEDLLTKARGDRIPLALTYGMTETASQIATLKPKDFLNGNNTCGQILPHAQVQIRNSTGEILDRKQVGTITISAKSLALGYYPEPFLNQHSFQVDDLGFIDDQGNLNIVGRSSSKIITGGENVFPFEVEAAIISTNLVQDVCVIGIPDKQWGEAVTAIYIPTNSQIFQTNLKIAINDKLTKFKQPKYWISVETFPRNAQGKVNREKMREIAINSIQYHYNDSAIQ